jgi:hypothetical protein
VVENFYYHFALYMVNHKDWAEAASDDAAWQAAKTMLRDYYLSCSEAHQENICLHVMEIMHHCHKKMVSFQEVHQFVMML